MARKVASSRSRTSTCGSSAASSLPSAGGVIVGGREVSGPLKIVGMAFQNPTLLPWRRALSNVLLPLEVVRPYRQRFRRDRAQHVERALALFRKVGLKDVADRFPWQLSGGMQQRVSLCRALIHQPELLLLDEPFGALDAFTREDLWEILQALWQERSFTVVLVTHDLAEAVYLADTVHVVSSRPGRILFSQHIDLPRPRRAEMRYSAAFGELARELRHHVGRAREGR
jgi:NitT/TauT family transport system ATP-binding protein